MASGKIAVDNCGKITDVCPMDDIDLDRLLKQLLEVARAYEAAENIDLSTVSWRALGDTKKLTAIVEGNSDIQTRRLLKTLQWFSDHWPENAIWPDSVVRPAPQLHEERVS